jgi:DNA-binding response OmpR family regulator
MRILVAEDEAFSRNVLVKALKRWGYEVVEATDGEEAWEILGSQDGPKLAILDWIMPGMNGIEVVRKVRSSVSASDRYVYIILLTQKASKDDMVAGLAAEADDYVVKPFDSNELRMRVRTGQRIVELQSALAAANAGLRKALKEVKTLSGLLPICASCKMIRNDEGYWQEIEAYVSDHSEAEFTHGICPDCAAKLYPELIRRKD